MTKKKTQTLTLTKNEMNDIRTALAVILSGFELNAISRQHWKRLQRKIIAQLEAQDPDEE